MDGRIEVIKTSRSVEKISSTAQRVIPELPSGFTNTAIAENLLSLIESKKEGEQEGNSWDAHGTTMFLTRS